MDKNIIITGGAGFIGTYLGKELLKKGYRVYSFDKNRGKNTSIKYYTLDLTNKEQLENLIGEVNPSAIVHLAGLVRGSYEELYTANVLGTKNLLECYKGRIIFLSAGTTYQGNSSPYSEEMPINPLDNYPKTKRIAEEFCLQRKNTTIIRASVVYGPHQKGSMFLPELVEKIKNKETLHMTAGEQKRDFLHVQDLCDAIYIFLENEHPGIFNISSGKQYSMKEVITMAKAIIGEFSVEHSIPYREHELWDYCLSREKAKQIINWEPKIPFEQGLREILEEKEHF